MRDPEQAAAVADAVAAYDPALPVLTLPGSALHEVGRGAAHRGRECFADRAYTAAGRLVSRREPGAVIHDARPVAARARRMAVDGTVEAADGTGSRSTPARSACTATPRARSARRRGREGLERPACRWRLRVRRAARG